ncbi:HET-domain-containing protein [Acephala macrosclerotiorum]|nr:HET-domain-containing protein [Acephala macrosclerotiorum]
MRLLHRSETGELSLTKNLVGDDLTPSYAILSHTWGPDNEEVTFEDMTNGTGKDKSGYAKIRYCGEQARQDGLQYFWIDTCCIDKSSSSELSEAINTMYHWYEKAEVCYALLSDFDGTSMEEGTALAACRWFTRGWCLQELIAPKNVEFFNSQWNFLGTRAQMAPLLSKITLIDLEVLVDNKVMEFFPVAHKMSWAARRETTREEDMAYCLLGIFDVNMPMLYGEGMKAFERLQEEIIKSSNDLSIFSFQSEDHPN